jgi:myo-inositol-1(or 4)-monophosphatase
MSGTPLDQRKTAAVRIAREAGTLAMSYFGDQSRLGVTLKSSQDWLTVADGAVEQMIREHLVALFPGDSILGEEGGGAGGERLWIIDPIDGTSNFARGDRTWCISVGYVENGVPEIGVVFAPALDEMWIAQRGRGATMNGVAVSVALTADIGRAIVEVGWSMRRPQADYLRLVERTMSAGAAVKRCASGALGMAHVANGRTDAYVELHINSWDVAAGYVIAKEAGALINDSFAGEAILQGNLIFCATPGIANALQTAACLNDDTSND